MTPQEMRERTAEFAERAGRLARPLLKNLAAQDAALQLASASASTAANYRAACVARSHAEFRAKIGLALEECDESVFWLEYLRRTGLSTHSDLPQLTKEGLELTRILGASRRTSARRALAHPRTLQRKRRHGGHNNQ
jgi:four helix bundle protein